MKNSASAGLFTGRHMAMVLAAFFGVIFAANFTMVYFAKKSWTGLVVQNSYVASQQFNETTAKLEKAAKDIITTVNYADGKLIITLADPHGKAVAATGLAVTLGRPSNEGQDQTVPLIAQGNGVFTAPLSLAKGQWTGRITAEIAGHEGWQHPLRLMVR